jgi:diguanylate cyclase (GGDEF)-like protein/PAS domain S-box-containing protein
MFPDDLARERKPHNPFVDLLLDVLPDPVLVLETQNEGAPTIYGANPAFFHLMGLGEKDRILGQSFLEYLDPSDKTPLIFPDGTAPGDRAEPLKKERVLLRKGQGRFLSELRMKRLVDGGESLCLVMVRDITEIHQREAFEKISREIEHYLKNEIPLESLRAFVIRNISGTFPFPEVSFSHEKNGIQPVESAGSGTPFADLYQRVFTLRENEFAKEEESITMEVRFRNSGDGTPSFLSCLDGFSGKMDKALEHFSQLQPRAEKDALFELAPDGICLIDFDSLKIIGTNPVFCRLMGFPDQSFLVGSSIVDWWELSEAGARKILGKVIDAKGSSFSFEQHHVRMDGSHILTSISGSCIPYGDSMALMLHVRDITAEHEAEILSRLSVELDQKILRGAPIMDLLEFIVRRISLEFSFQIVFFTIPSPQGTIAFVGIDPAFPKYSPLLDRVLFMNRWDLPPGSESSFGRAIRTGLPQFATGDDLEHSPIGDLCNAFGIASVFSVPVTRDAGQLPWGALTIADQNVNDLSERLRSRLIELSERIRIAFIRHEEMDLVRVLKLAMESSRNIEFIALKDGTIEWANASFFKTVQSDGPLSEMDLSAIFPEPASKGQKITMTEVIALAGSFTGEFMGVTATGHPFLVETMVVPLKDRFGVVDRMLIQQKEITQDREIELIDRLMSQLDEMILLGKPFSMLASLVATKARELFYAEAVAIGVVGSDRKIHARAQSASSPLLEEELREWVNHPKPDGIEWNMTSESLIQESSPLAGWMNGNQIQEFRRFPLIENNRDNGYIAFFFKKIGVLESSSLDRIEKLARRFSLVCERYQQEEQRRLHETAMSTVANGILITGSDCRIQWVNDAFLQMSGFRRDELIGQTPFILRHFSGEIPQTDEFWKIILSGETFEGFLEDQKKDGSGYTVEATVTPIRMNDEIKNFVVIQKDQTQRIQQEREIFRLAHTDQLTGLLNRQAFMERIKLEISHASRSGDQLALLFLDLDGFKKINDTWGHGAGDFFLKTIGERILSGIRSSDVVARLGGDEFVVLLKNVPDQAGLEPFLDTFVRSLSVPVPYDVSPLCATVSIGVSLFPKDAGTAQEMIKKADMAMYCSKNKGKNTWCFYQENLGKERESNALDP